MREDERVWAVKDLLFDYVKSPSLRHIRDPHSVTRLAQEIVRRIDRSNSIWQKWDGQRELLLKSALCCWIPVADMRDFLNAMPGPPLTTTDVAQRLKAIEEEEHYDYLRELQRRHDAAVLVVHHAKKGGGGVRAGQALRGSSEFHAWGDSNLYLRRDGDDLSLSVEHRAAPSMTPITIELAQRGTALALEVVDRRDPATPPPSSLDERITATLAGADAALPFAELRACCRVRATTLYERLAVLADTGRVVKTDDGYRLADG